MSGGNHNGEKVYKKGKIYKSEVDDSITDETGNTYHGWSSPQLLDHFLKITGDGEVFIKKEDKELPDLATMIPILMEIIKSNSTNSSFNEAGDLANAVLVELLIKYKKSL